MAPAADLLARLQLTCAQWSAMAPADKLARVRAGLEQRGHASLNTPTRGALAYAHVAALDAYCVLRAAPAPATYASNAGSPDRDDGVHGTAAPLPFPRKGHRAPTGLR